MLEGTKILARQTIRQAIWELCNKHTPGSKPDIALVGSRRSGSTLLMQAIGQHHGIKSIDQPFSVFTATSAQMFHLPWPEGGFYFNPSESEQSALLRYIENLKYGRIHVQEPWRVWSNDFNFRTDRLVMKTTDAHFLTPLLRQQGFIVINYLRHPIPQALSCQRNNWGDKLEFFSRNRKFMENALSKEQKNILEKVRRSEGKESRLIKYVLCWCLENMQIFLSDTTDTPIVYYEDMILKLEETIEILNAACSLENSVHMKRAFKRASVSVSGLSDESAVFAIKSGNLDELIGRWHSRVSKGDIARVQEVLDLFPKCPYTADVLLPIKHR